MKEKDTPCTWKDEEICEDCSNQGQLNCRWSAGDLLQFYAISLPAMIAALAGTVIIGLTQGIWWPLIAYILMYPVVLGIGESRFLCSHCPYYAEEGMILHCPANHGLIKIWRHHPEPMNRLEKSAMIVFVIVFLSIPLIILGYDIFYFAQHSSIYSSITTVIAATLFLVTALSIMSWITVMYRNICSKCVNFSCPFNRVDKEKIDIYLSKNSVMRKAWEKEEIGK